MATPEVAVTVSRTLGGASTTAEAVLPSRSGPAVSCGVSTINPRENSSCGRRLRSIERIGALLRLAAEGGVNLIGGPDAFDPASLTGETPAEVEAQIPPDWVRTPSKSGGGEVFSDPANPGRQIRIMPGYGAGVRPDPLTAGPYAVVSQNGVVTKVPLAGNPTLP
jgi:hypothetical protein